MADISSKNVIGADNQQERLKIVYWITGFTDGEGCFSIAVIKNKTTKFGKQIFPEFVVTQGAKSLTALEKIKNFFGCGNIFINKRYDNHNENLYRYCVRSLGELNVKILPFFRKYPLQTYKQKDFLIFEKVVKMMIKKKHLTEKGRKEVLAIISEMNRRKKRF
ncbi:endonuclease [Candidatus Parcubacteria bacterium]|nr:endonuclease [Candidatus Parcubacteria bacterium]